MRCQIKLRASWVAEKPLHAVFAFESLNIIIAKHAEVIMF